MLAVAVGTALAVTVGGVLSAVPATADTVAGVRATASAVPYPKGRGLWGLGRTGFLTWDDTSATPPRWTRFSDGATTSFAAGHSVLGSRDSDTVIDMWRGGVTLRDMATGTAPLWVDLSTAGPDAQEAGAVGSTLFVTTANATGGQNLDLYAPGDTAPSKRAVTGLPANATGLFAVGAAGTDALLSYRTGSGTTARHHWAVVDLTTATVTAQRARASDGGLALSATHVAWTEPTATGLTTVNVLNRATGLVQRFSPGAGDLTVSLVGDWVTYARRDGLRDYSPDPLHALTARNLTTGATRKLLDHVVTAVDAPGDAIGVQGGTVAQGEGLYRIAPGTGGVPVATLVASSGEPTRVALLGHGIPSVIDLSRTGSVDLTWRLSRINVGGTLTLRNTRTGDTLVDDFHPLSEQAADFTYAHYAWHGDMDWPGDASLSTGAKTGTYTWRIDAEPLNGIGPALVASGSFSVIRSRTQPHDFDGDGSPDLLARDTTGRLWLGDSFYERDGGYTRFVEPYSKAVSGGWNIYDRIEATGNLGGSGVGDFVARDRAGVLWLFKGRGDTTFSSRIRIGAGWNVYDRIAGGSDLTGDGRPDLLATDKAGVLWLHPGTGRDTAPFAARRKLGTGWGIYTRITAVGDLAGGPAGDLVARDRAGVLWLHLGKGDGTLAPRTRIGGGWGAGWDLVGLGDADRDGRADLSVSESYLYRGTGDWHAPLRPREETSALRWAPSIEPFDLFA
ncbi:FG-GAP repeat domain-containing protein [Streptomyces sp. NPDC004266]|uniref:FG-GAP repeat domain-containing protein n=1 Tax=Streptomyces sp. NPDC004266 TaxID=3364693 RepID=UPI0036819BA8